MVAETRGRLTVARGRDREDKTVVVVECFAAHRGPVRLTVRPLRGYERFARRTIRRLRKVEGVAPDESEPMLAASDGPDAAFGGGEGPAPPDLDPDERSDVACKRLLARLDAMLEMNQPGIEADLDPECLHDFRVATRKARSLLREMRRVFPRRVTRAAQSGSRLARTVHGAGARPRRPPDGLRCRRRRRRSGGGRRGRRAARASRGVPRSGVPGALPHPALRALPASAIRVPEVPRSHAARAAPERERAGAHRGPVGRAHPEGLSPDPFGRPGNRRREPVRVASRSAQVVQALAVSAGVLPRSPSRQTRAAHHRAVEAASRTTSVHSRTFRSSVRFWRSSGSVRRRRSALPRSMPSTGSARR